MKTGAHASNPNNLYNGTEKTRIRTQLGVQTNGPANHCQIPIAFQTAKECSENSTVDNTILIGQHSQKKADTRSSTVKQMQTAKSNSRKYVSVDPGKCTGCGICEYACTLEKCEQWNPLKSRIRVLRFTPLLNAAMTCRFCKDAPCVKACPEKALTQSETSGLLILNERKCNGCDWCIQACPHGGITLDPDKRIAITCDLCDGEPKCIEFCPEEALELVSDDEATEKKWSTALEKLPAETERLTNIVKKRDWTSMLADAEKRAKKTAEKLEAINKRQNSLQKH